jgi:acetyl esterase
LAPEHRFPAALDDALAAFRDAAEHVSQHPGRVAVGGDSAGGNLAVGVARLAALRGGPAPIFQLLFYPWLDLSRRRRSYSLFGEGFYLSANELEWYASLYATTQTDVLDPRCSPLVADQWSGVAPAYIATAGFDPLRDEGEEYAACLQAAGTQVTLRRHAGLLHGFLDTLGSGRVARAALADAATALRARLRSPA